MCALPGKIELPSGEMGEAAAWFAGGQLSDADLLDASAMHELGSLYGRLHQGGSSWFDSSADALRLEKRLPPTAAAADWASCLWILPWMMEQVPAVNRVALAEQGVDWEFIASEISGMPDNPLLPATPTVTVHGDSHTGNVIKDSNGQLRLIDFDMTARGPAGSELGFLVLMLFRCGFAPELVLPIEIQRAFARGYLSTSSGNSGGGGEVAELELLRVAHAWGYFGLIKMGLLCAVLMANEGHDQKRAVMRIRGPVLLHRDFLVEAQAVLREAAPLEGGDDARAQLAEDLLRRGLFFVVEERWMQKAKQ